MLDATGRKISSADHAGHCASLYHVSEATVKQPVHSGNGSQLTHKDAWQLVAAVQSLPCAHVKLEAADVLCWCQGVGDTELSRALSWQPCTLLQGRADCTSSEGKEGTWNWGCCNGSHSSTLNNNHRRSVSHLAMLLSLLWVNSSRLGKSTSSGPQQWLPCANNSIARTRPAQGSADQ